MPNSFIWEGRITDPKLGRQYWYQHIDCIDLNDLDSLASSRQERQVAILGYACDAGVKRNQGRLGALYGPKACREKLSKLAFHHDHTRVIDGGDIICINENLEACQAALAHYVQRLLNHSFFPIVIGGGHDIAYGHFLGIYNSNRMKDDTKIGIINFDAHFDLRPVNPVANSGTPFNQILSSNPASVDYLVIGLQEESNTPSLFNIAQDYNVRHIPWDECVEANWSEVCHKLMAFVKNFDHIYITIDLDGVSSAFAPGVSAPSPLGMSPAFLFKCLSLLMQTDKVISCDIAELNPTFDIDSITSTLAARMVNHITRLFNERKK